MERWLNAEIQQAVRGSDSIKLLNPFRGIARCSSTEQQKRLAFRTSEARRKLEDIVEKVNQVLCIQSTNSALHPTRAGVIERAHG